MRLRESGCRGLMGKSEVVQGRTKAMGAVGRGAGLNFRCLTRQCDRFRKNVEPTQARCGEHVPFWQVELRKATLCEMEVEVYDKTLCGGSVFRNSFNYWQAYINCYT